MIMSELSFSELDKLVKSFQALKTHEEKVEFLHNPANADLRRVISSIHFPKPEATPEFKPNS